MIEEWKSQLGQDRAVDEILKGKTRGVFVDIGAHDGVTISNTWFFEKKRGWTGLCVEPLPARYKELVKNRSNSQCWNGACVASIKEKEQNFLAIEGYSEMLSGLLDSYDPQHTVRIERENKQHDQKFSKCKLRVWMASIQKAVSSGKIVSVYQNNPSLLQLISFTGKWSFRWTDSKNSPMLHVDEYWVTAIQSSLFTNTRVEYGYAEFDIKKKNSTQNDYPFDIPRKKWKFVLGEATSFKIAKGPHVSPCHVNSTFMDFPHNVHLPTKTHEPHYLDIEDKSTVANSTLEISASRIFTD